MSKQCVIYRRVSTKRQDTEGKSLEDQDAELADYCKALGFKVIGNFEDAISGRREKTHKRKGLAKAIETVCQEKATLVVHDLDRLARSQSAGMRIVEQLRDHGAQLVVKSLGLDTNTPAGEMVVGIMFAVAQWGSRAIGEGVKRANRQTVRTLGHRTQGEQPFGYRFSEELGQVTKCAEEQEIIRQVMRVHAKSRSYAQTAERLNELGIPTARKVRKGINSKWSDEIVRRLVHRVKGD